MPTVVDPARIAHEEIPPLPEGWIPDDAVVFAVAEQEDGHWSVVLPRYAIVGVGDTLNAAGREAVELLEDYLRMCAAEGRSFAESRRPIPASWLAKLIVGQLAESVRHRVRHNSIRGRFLRVPARGALNF